jgi:hypothetical protein
MQGVGGGAAIAQTLRSDGGGQRKRRAMQAD